MAERKSGPVKPPVIDLKANDATQPAESEKPAARSAKPASRAKADTTVSKSEPAKPAPQAPVEKTDASSEAAAAAKPASSSPPRTEPKPEAVRAQATSAQAATPVRQAKLAMPWSAISIAVVAGAVLGTALTYALVNLVPLPSTSPGFADPTERLVDLDGRLAALEDRLPALEQGSLKTQVSLDATITQLDTGLNQLKSAQDALTTRIDTVQASVPSAADVDLAPLTAQLDTLDARVTAIAAGASSADAAALAESLNGIEASIAAMTARLDGLDGQVGQIDGIRSDLETAKSAIAKQTQTLGGANIGPAVKLPLVVSGLETAFAAGRPFATELESLSALLPDLAVPETLAAAAETGLARPDRLLGDFQAVVPTILAGRTAESTGDWGKDAIEWTKGLLALRPTGEMPGNTPEAIVSRLEAAMERQDFVAADDLLGQLPSAMQSAAGDVATAIRNHAAAEDFVAALRAQALAPTTEAAQ